MILLKVEQDVCLHHAGVTDSQCLHVLRIATFLVPVNVNHREYMYMYMYEVITCTCTCICTNLNATTARNEELFSTVIITFLLSCRSEEVQRSTCSHSAQIAWRLSHPFADSSYDWQKQSYSERKITFGSTSASHVHAYIHVHMIQCLTLPVFLPWFSADVRDDTQASAEQL